MSVIAFIMQHEYTDRMVTPLGRDEGDENADR
jgi:hypothetical protein